MLLFVCFDIFFNFFLEKIFFGLKAKVSARRKLSGPFGDELIAGGYIQRFFIFFFFFSPIFFFLKKNILFIF